MPLLNINPFRILPITFRAALAITLSFVAIRYLATPLSDIVAHLIGIGMLSLILLSLIICTITKRYLLKNLSAKIYFDNKNIISKIDTQAGMEIQNASLPPFFSLSVKRLFRNEGTISPTYLLTGRLPKRHLMDSVYFPHRGIWALDGIELRLCDNLGFCSFKWKINIDASVEVSPALAPIGHLPIIAASSRSGDMDNFSNVRSGDLFDIKPYDPSDGVSRILWKTYAKTSELVVRRPEPATIPEGDVAVYLIANRHEDNVAGALLSYLDYLSENQIRMLFGTDAMASTSHQAHCLIDQQDIKRAINDNAWDQKLGTACDFEQYLQSLGSQNANVSRIVIFAPLRFGSWLETANAIAQARGLSLSIVLVVDKCISNNESLTVPGNAKGEEIIKAIAKTDAQLILCNDTHI